MSEHKQLYLLAVGAHPVDMEVTCGAVLAKYTRAGHRATLLHLTHGEKGHPGKSPAEYKEQKRRESHACAERLGCEVRWLDYKDAEVPTGQEIELEICDIIRELQPDIVITSWKGSFHRDHVAAHVNTVRGMSYAGLATMERPLPAHRVSRVYFTDNWEDQDGFEPEIYVDIEDTFEQWAEAVQEHQLVKGGVVSFPYLEYYKALAVIRGAESGCRLAQAFAQPAGARKKLVQELPLA